MRGRLLGLACLCLLLLQLHKVSATYDCLYEARHCDGYKFSEYVRADAELKKVFKNRDFAGTCLIPSDAAFDKLKLDGSESIRDILLYHALDDVVYKKQLVSSSPLQTLFKPHKLTFTASGTAITIKGDRSSATIVKGDYKTIKGVAHCIDTVLLPPIADAGPSYPPKYQAKPTYTKPKPKPYTPKPKSYTPKPTSKCTTAWDYINSREDMSIWADLIRKAGAVDLLTSTTTSGTVFLPDNKALKYYARQRGVSVYNLDEHCSLRDLVRNHISTGPRVYMYKSQSGGRRLQQLPGLFGLSVAQSSRVNQIPLFSTQSVFAAPWPPAFGFVPNINTGRIRGRRLAQDYNATAPKEVALWAAWSTASVVEPDIPVCNMVAHTINNALAPSSWGGPVVNAIPPLYNKPAQLQDQYGSVDSLLQATPLTSLAYLLFGQSSLRPDTLNLANTYTWAVPSNEAFCRTTQSLQPYFDDSAKLTLLLQNHVLSTEPLESSSLNDGDSLTSLAGVKLTVSKPGVEADITIDGPTSQADLVITDIGAARGVAHITNGLLLPY